MREAVVTARKRLDVLDEDVVADARGAVGVEVCGAVGGAQGDGGEVGDAAA